MTFFDHESEGMILSSMMIDKAVIERLQSTLKPEDFEREVHRTVFDDLIRLHRSGMIADASSVIAEFRRRGDSLAAVDVSELSGMSPSSANVDYYVGIVKDLSLKRATFRIIDTARMDLADKSKKGTDVSGAVEKSMAEVNLSNCGTSYQHVSRHLGDVGHGHRHGREPVRYGHVAVGALGIGLGWRRRACAAVHRRSEHDHAEVPPGARFARVARLG
jgi:replicative DNA helicase